MARSTEDSLRAVATVLLLEMQSVSPSRLTALSGRFWGKDREVFRALVAEMEAKP